MGTGGGQPREGGELSSDPRGDEHIKKTASQRPALETKGGEISCPRLRIGPAGLLDLWLRRRPGGSFLRLHKERGGAEARSEAGKV